MKKTFFLCFLILVSLCVEAQRKKSDLRKPADEPLYLLPVNLSFVPTQQASISTLMDDIVTCNWEAELFFEKLNAHRSGIVKSNNKAKDACEDSPVYINEVTAISREYLLAHEYFGIWDSLNVNPYGFDIKDFKDTVRLKLYDEETGKNWASPIKPTEVNSKFGARWYRWHHGIDLGLKVGDTIRAAFDGVVRVAKYNRGGYGNYIMLRHANGLETLYAHLSKSLVKVGEEVLAGQIIGLGGNTGRSTGPHLHFEARYQGHAFNPKHLFDFATAQLTVQDFDLTTDHYAQMIEEQKAVYHKIRGGDTLSHIAHRYRTTIGRLCSLNGISRKTILRVGRKLRVR